MNEKPFLKEVDAVNKFISEIHFIVNKNFSETVLPDIKEILGRGFNNDPEYKRAVYEFTLVILFVESQAIGNLFPPTQAQRINMHLKNAYKQIDHKENGYLQTSMLEYQNAWNVKLARHQLPLDELVVKLVSKMGFHKSKIFSCIKTLKIQTNINDHQLLHLRASILDSIVEFIKQISWWKKVGDKFNIVE